MTYGITTEHQSDLNERLFEAIRAGKIAVVTKLLAEGADVNAVDEQNRAALHWVSSHNHTAIANLFLDKKARVNVVNQWGFTPLHNTAEMGNIEITTKLLANGADPNAANNEGETPLHFAISHRHTHLAQILIANGADPSAKNNKGETPIDLAENFETKQILLSTRMRQARNAGIIEGILQNPMDPFHEIEVVISHVLENHLKHPYSRANAVGTLVAEHLAKIGCAALIPVNKAGAELAKEKVRALYGKYSSDLFEVAKANNAEGVKMALYFGADVRIKDEYGNTAKDYANNATTGTFKSVAVEAAQSLLQVAMREQSSSFAGSIRARRNASQNSGRSA